MVHGVSVSDGEGACAFVGTCIPYMTVYKPGPN